MGTDIGWRLQKVRRENPAVRTLRDPKKGSQILFIIHICGIGQHIIKTVLGFGLRSVFSDRMERKSGFRINLQDFPGLKGVVVVFSAILIIKRPALQIKVKFNKIIGFVIVENGTFIVVEFKLQIFGILGIFDIFDDKLPFLKFLIDLYGGKNFNNFPLN